MKSEVIGRCGGDKKNEWPRRTDKSRSLKNAHTIEPVVINELYLQPITMTTTIQSTETIEKEIEGLTTEVQGTLVVLTHKHTEEGLHFQRHK